MFPKIIHYLNITVHDICLLLPRCWISKPCKCGQTLPLRSLNPFQNQMFTRMDIIPNQQFRDWYDLPNYKPEERKITKHHIDKHLFSVYIYIIYIYIYMYQVQAEISAARKSFWRLLTPMSLHRTVFATAWHHTLAPRGFNGWIFQGRAMRKYEKVWKNDAFFTNTWRLLEVPVAFA